MSALDTWNAAADRWWTWTVQAVLASSVAFAVVTVVWLVIRRRASAHLGHVLFLVPLAPLALPSLGAYELPVRVRSPWVADDATRDLDPDSGLPTVGRDASRRADAILEPVALRTAMAASQQAGPEASSRRPTRRAWIAATWLGSVVALLLLFVASQRRTQRLLRAAPALGGAAGERLALHLARLAPRFGVERPLRVVESEALAAPAVWGGRRPVLVFDRALAEHLDDDQLDWVLSHELAHLERRDWIRGALQRCVQLAYFFHPLVWITGRVADELREAACDESALAHGEGSRRKACATALAEVAARTVPAPHRTLLFTLEHDKRHMKRRILRILDPARLPAHRSSRTGLIACAALACSATVQWTFAQEPTTHPAAERAEEGSILDREIRQSIQLGIEWLLAQQHADGHWPTGPGGDDAAGNFNSIGVTGFVLLALERERAANGGDRVASAIERGRAYLERIQREDGLFGEEIGSTFMQSHAVATLAWLKTRSSASASAWRPAAERAVAIILGARNPGDGWRFELLPIGENDSFTTSLMLAALKEAQDAGIEVPAPAWEEPLAYIDRLTAPESGRTGYETEGGDDARLWIKREGYPVELTQLATAAALSTRQTWGQDPHRSSVIRRGALLLTTCAPRWDVEAGSIDYYYWMFGTRALAPIGGVVFEHWRESVVEALVPNQLRDGAGGWWPAIDAWTPEGESIHATVMCTLALQEALGS